MPDPAALIKTWWKQMFAVVLLSVVIVGILVFLKPREFLSVSTAVPASTFTSDRAAIFNENIQALYTALGSPDDLDRILGTANLDTIYLSVTDEFNLYDHYKISAKDEDARIKAARQLKGNTKVIKSEYGELKVKVWDTDKNLAPELANALMKKLNAIHQSIHNENNVFVLAKLKKGREKIANELDTLTNSILYDSANAVIISKVVNEEELKMRSIRREALLQQLAQSERLINQYQVMADNSNPVLIVVEKARAASRPDKPKRMQLMIATAVLSGLFSLLVALVLERRKIQAK